MIELRSNQLQLAVPLYQNYPYLHGYVASALSGEMGAVSVDDIECPSVGRITLGWANILAGDAATPAAETLLGEILPNTILIPENARWVDAFYGRWGHRLEKWRRITCRGGSWRIETLRDFERRLPSGYTIKQVSCPEEVKGLIQMGDGLIDFPNYPTPEDFLDRGVGFFVERNGEIVSGCTSYAVGGGKSDISVRTRQEHQRRGLAQAVAARMILYCLQDDIEPCWDAPSEAGGNLGKKLGYTYARPYTAFRVLKVREHWNSTSWM
ncbi:MAG: GNAT family N-acetyltransferase [Candidatus Poribacteria bacterium]|nr:GNAT family N-acetyltransferase [Candidatus Poribacteria bacterium]